MGRLGAITVELAMLAITHVNRGNGMGTALRAVREQAFCHFQNVNPVGTGNSKTGCPSTYRLVGDTCPSTCPFHGECYARQGRTAHAAQRASSEAAPSLAAAAVALATADAYSVAARLQVSGDLCRNGAVDREYVDGLCQIGQALGALSDRPIAWTYTHVAGFQGSPDWLALASAGIVVRQSDSLGAYGAAVYPHDRLSDLPLPRNGRARASYYRPCPAQAAGSAVKCRDCRLCRSHAGVVVLAPHGHPAPTLADCRRILGL